MSNPLNTPDRLFDRTWRPGHPFRPRLSRSRRFGMLLLFLFLCALIGGYRYVTNSDRVRAQAEEYLSRLTGGTVKVGGATLSIFEGLRLDDVRVYVDPSKSPDSLIFTASTFLIENRPSALLRGRIEATRLVAIDPHVRLAENVATRRWNYAQLTPQQHQPPTKTQIPRNVPEISLRNAIVDYYETGNDKPIGSVAIDGQLTPDPANDRYNFKLQSRGASQQLGPRAEGSIGITSGDLSVTLWNLGFDNDLQAMLPAQVRNWWIEHGLAGTVEQTDLTTNLTDPQRPFKASIKVNNVALTVQPQELLSHDEMNRRQIADEGFDMLRAAGLNGHGYVDHLSDLIAATPIRLDDVDGLFTFDQNGIDINDLKATVEKNRFDIKGHYDGYGADAPASIQLTNADNQPVNIPAKAQYINSLPNEVREAYTRFQPRGTCTVSVNYVRSARGDRPQVTGEVNLLDGAFTFEKFAYPLRKATGRITVQRDEKTGEESLHIDQVKGRGAAGGPNENANIEIDGQIGPFGSDAGVTVIVKGHGVSSEPQLMAAFPPKTRQALKFFDAPGKGEFPKFKGNFTCTIIRFPEVESHWSIETRIHLDDATGSLVAFPYPMDHVSGDLTVNDDHILIKQAVMKRGDSDLLVRGRVDWGPTTEPTAGSPTAQSNSTDTSLRPSIEITAHNVPIDANLIRALPPMQGRWLSHAGAAGKFDLNGTLNNGKTDRAADLNFNFDVNLHDCSLWPQGKAYLISKLNGLLKLTPQKLVLADLTAKRGDADVTAHGSVDWPTSPAKIAIVAEAKNLAMDQQLYQMLPDAAQKGWNQVQPVGSVDAKLTYNGTAEEDRVSGVGSRVSGEIKSIPVTLPSSSNPNPDTRTPNPDSSTPEGFEVVLTPRTLSITPKAIPYSLDGLTGSATITNSTVKIDNLIGHHGGAEVHLSATGSTDSNGAWDFQVAGNNMWIDNDFKKAIPASLESLLQTAQMHGTIGFNFTKLKIWTDPAATTNPSAFAKPGTPKPGPSGSEDASQSPITQTPPGPEGPGFATASAKNLPDPTDVDFDVKLNLTDASLDAGVPLAKVNGTTEFIGSTRLGKLTDLSGKLDIPTLQVAGRTATDFRADLAKHPQQDLMRLANLQANLAGGQLAGQIEWAYPDNAPLRYAMALVLHNADVHAVAGDSMPDASGQLSASLSMEGTENDEYSRRGGGDVALSGQQLYKIPLMLGLFQVTSLSLPLTSPFNEGSCHYTIDGSRVTFDTIELRAQGMTMSGNGHLDFDTGRVGMTFVTENTTWPKLPIIGDVIQGARDELLQIHVRGTIQEPKVSATSLNTLTTTVDEVLKGGNPPPDLPPVKKRTPTAQKPQSPSQ